MDAPPVWLWYRIYAIVVGLLYGFIVAGLMSLMVITGGQGMNDEDMVTFVFAIVVCIPFAAAHLAAPFLPRAPWAWMYHMVIIGLGLTSVCCLATNIPLVIFWLKPETKQFFGRTD